MTRPPSDYREWRSRRNNIAMTLCSAKSRSEGGVCSCYNGDMDPDRSHFSGCRKAVSSADEALNRLEVPIPAKVREDQ